MSPADHYREAERLLDRLYNEDGLDRAEFLQRARIHASLAAAGSALSLAPDVENPW